MTAPLVTVIIPSYNHGGYIEQTINSVLRQTYHPIEVIVIDDGSSDDSPQLLGQLAAQHGFRLELQTNQGLSRTLNAGIALANGKYVCTVGSDDILMLDKTEKQVEFMEANPHIAVCGGNQLLIDSTGQLINKRQYFSPHRELNFDDLFLGRKALIAASSAMMRRDVLDREGGYDPNIPLEDMYMWFKLTSRGHTIAGLNDVLIYYRKHESNSYKNVSYMVDSMLKTFALYTDHAQHAQVVNNYLISMFLRAAKYDRGLALSILKKVKYKYYNVKVLRGLAYCIRP